MRPPDILDDFDFEEPAEWLGEKEVVAKYYSIMEAELAAARLRSEGIPCFIANAISQTMMPHVQGYVRLQTRPEDAERAREILVEAAEAADNPPVQKFRNNLGLLLSAILIGLMLAWMLVKSI